MKLRYTLCAAADLDRLLVSIAQQSPRDRRQGRDSRGAPQRARPVIDAAVTMLSTDGQSVDAQAKQLTAAGAPKVCRETTCDTSAAGPAFDLIFGEKWVVTL